MLNHRGNHWGWGLYVDLKGNLRDAFAGFQKSEKKPEEQPAQKPGKWHVKKHPRKVATAAR